MKNMKQRYLIIAALTLVLAVPALAEDTAGQPLDMNDVQGAVAPESQQPLQGEQCRAEEGSASGELSVEALAALRDTRPLQSMPCQGAAEGSEMSTVPACNCELDKPCNRPCISASQTPTCLDIDCILSSSNDFNGVCVCV